MLDRIFSEKKIWCSTEIDLETSKTTQTFNKILRLVLSSDVTQKKICDELNTILLDPDNPTVALQTFYVLTLSFLYTLKNVIFEHKLNNIRLVFSDLNLKPTYNFYTLHRDHLQQNTYIKDLFSAFASVLECIELPIEPSIVIGEIKKRFRQTFEDLLTQNKDFSLFFYYYLFRENFEGADLHSSDLSNMNFTQAHLSGANLSSANLRNTNLCSANLNGAVLIDAILEGANMYLINAEHVNLYGANLRNTQLLNSNLASANLISSDLTNSILENTNLQEANFSFAVLKDTNCSGANLENSIFEGTSLENTDFENANLSGTEFKDARFMNINFSGATLQYANLTDKDLHEMDLSGMNLQGANLTGCNLEGVNFENTDLRNACLKNANLSNTNLYATNFYNADLTNIKLNDAYLYFAMLTCVKNLSHQTLKTSKNWSKAFYDVVTEGNIGLVGEKRFARTDLKLIDKIPSLKDVKKEYQEYLKQRIDWDSE